MTTRQILLDTETTGLEPSQGHRIIEIGCVELVGRRLTGNHFHQYLQPDRDIDSGAIAVHGITPEFLADMPRFRDIVDTFLDYIRGAELIIHNAPFDMGFLRHELGLLKRPASTINTICTVSDSLTMARKLHPAQKNSLDALCKRYQVDNAQRTLHGALLDAEILADVYLAMTGGQRSLSLGGQTTDTMAAPEQTRPVSSANGRLRVLVASQDELVLHEARLSAIKEASGGQCLWPG